MKNWKTVLAAGIILLIGLEILRPKSDHASVTQAIQGSTGAPIDPCTPPLINIDAKTMNASFCGEDNKWHRAIPSGTVIMSLSRCEMGWTEIQALNGQFLRGTTVANADVGTSGGSATITPTGVVSQPVFTGDVQQFSTAVNVSLLGVGTALTGPASPVPTGTVSQPTFVGASFDPSPPYTKVIFCQMP